jgi:hypothetical protein
MGHLAHTGEKKMCTQFWWGNLQERVCLEDLSVYESKIEKGEVLPRTGHEGSEGE